MGIIAWVFQNFKVKPVRYPDGGVRLHVIPLDGENHGSSYTWHGWFCSVLAKRYGAEAVDLDRHPDRALILHKYYVDDLTVQDLKDPSWYLEYFNEEFREWIQNNGEQLYREIVPDNWKSRNSWLSVRGRVLVGGGEPLTEEEECRQWIESMCEYVSKLETWYREGKTVVYAERLLRTALDWWLFEEALILEMDENLLWELKAKDPEFEDWWVETKEQIYRSGQKAPWWLLSLEELGLSIPERFKGLGTKQEYFSFNTEEVLEDLSSNQKWVRQVEAYRRYRRGAFQDDIAKNLGVTQSTISKWITAVKGEIGRRMGDAYEKHLYTKLQLREDVEEVRYDGRKGRPDFILKLRDGSYEVISAKCYDSDRRSVSIPIGELDPELEEARRLQAQGHQVKLTLDFYNIDDNHHETREIPINNPPKRLLFHHT